MAFLQRLKAWGAVEKNGRRLHLINNSILLGFPIGFGIVDLLLSRLQHGNLASLQHAACALQWVNVVTVHFMPEHIRHYVELHCAISELSTETISYIYIMLKITLSVLFGFIINTIVIILIISGDDLQIKAIYFDMSFNFVQRYVYSNKKTLIKSLLFTIPVISVAIFSVFYILFLQIA